MKRQGEEGLFNQEKELTVMAEQFGMEDYGIPKNGLGSAWIFKVIESFGAKEYNV